MIFTMIKIAALAVLIFLSMMALKVWKTLHPKYRGNLAAVQATAELFFPEWTCDMVSFQCRAGLLLYTGMVRISNLLNFNRR